jgi:PRTRC genetic system protein A
MNLAGYIVHSPGGDLGTRGSAYTYVLAGNGLFLEAENPHLEARTHLTTVAVRGLPLLKPRLELQHGKVPGHLAALALSVMGLQPDREAFAAIAWDGNSYRLLVPPQEGNSASVVYDTVPNTVVGLHSHGRMGAFFSTFDNLDDQGFQVEIVLGHLDRLVPSALARLCVYGYYAPVDLREVFLGLPPWIEAEG